MHSCSAAAAAVARQPLPISTIQGCPGGESRGMVAAVTAALQLSLPHQQRHPAGAGRVGLWAGLHVDVAGEAAGRQRTCGSCGEQSCTWWCCWQVRLATLGMTSYKLGGTAPLGVRLPLRHLVGRQHDVLLRQGRRCSSGTTSGNASGNVEASKRLVTCVPAKVRQEVQISYMERQLPEKHGAPAQSPAPVAGTAAVTAVHPGRRWPPTVGGCSGKWPSVPHQK